MGRRSWLVLASSLVLVFVAGCQGLAAATGGSPGSANPCSTNDVRQVVVRFIDAFNRGDIAQLDQLVYQRFSLYATNTPGERLNAQAHDRDN